MRVRRASHSFANGRHLPSATTTVPIGTILKSGEVFVAVLSHIVSQSAFSCPADTTKMNLKF